MFNQYQSTLEMSKQMNNDISKRHIPTTHLQPYLNVRPVNTKYELFYDLQEQEILGNKNKI